MKKSFTLIEMILVIILISTIYVLVFVNFDFQIKEKKFKFELETLKDSLFKNFDFNEELWLRCIQEDNIVCYVFIDGKIDKNIKIGKLFSDIPDVYTLNKRELVNYTFTKFRLDNIEYEPFFELKIDKNKKHKDLIVDTEDDKVYFFSSISTKAKIFDNTNEIIDNFLNLEVEVKDAL